MPTSVLPGGIFYASDLFERPASPTTPTTIDELEAADEKLKASGRRTHRPRREGRLAGRALVLLLRAARVLAGRHGRSRGELAASTTRAGSKAGEDLQTFADTEPFNDGFLTTSAQQGAGISAGLVANHQAAMELMGAWDPGVIASLTPDQKPLPDLAWFPFPEVAGGDGEPGAMMGGVDGYSCSVNAPKECADFLNFIGREGQPGGVRQGVPHPARQPGGAGRRHRARTEGGPRGLQRGAVRLAVAGHPLRPEHRQRAERRGRRHARRQGRRRRASSTPSTTRQRSPEAGQLMATARDSSQIADDAPGTPDRRRGQRQTLPPSGRRPSAAHRRPTVPRRRMADPASRSPSWPGRR